MIELHYIVLIAFVIASLVIGVGMGALIQIKHRRKVRLVRRINRSKDKVC